MKTIEVTDATSVKDLVTLATQEAGVVLTQGQKPVARVVPIPDPAEAPPIVPQLRKLGLHPGAWLVSDDFDEPLPDEFWLGQE